MESIFCALKWDGIDIYFENKLNFLLRYFFFRFQNQFGMCMFFYLLHPHVVYVLPMGNQSQATLARIKIIRTGAQKSQLIIVRFP